ncbi:MAG: phage holin, LLH family [Eubacteriales bacterium]|nr:phage holin, LLH family [Eubacteriales bacterium]
MNEKIIILIAAMLIILALILLLQTKYKKQAAEVLLYLVTRAEQQLGGGTGQLKYSAVTMWLYEQLPSLARLLLPARVIDGMIEDAVERMKMYLEENEKAKMIVGGV